MRLVVGRLVAAWRLLIAASVAALVTAVLVTAFLLYATLLPQAGVRQAVADAPAADRLLTVTSSAGNDAAALAARDAAVRELVAGGLAGTPLAVHAGGHTIGQRLAKDPPGADGGPNGTYAVVAFLDGLADHATLVDGAWPQPVPADAPAQVVLSATVARQLGLSVGDRVEIVDEIAKADRPLALVGVWQPHDPDDPFWQLAAGTLAQGGWGPLVVHADEFTARYQRLATLKWVMAPDPGALARAGMSAVAADVRAIAADLERRKEDAASPLDATTRLTTGLAELADQLATATVVNRSGLVVPAALLTVTGGYGLVLLARLLVGLRRPEQALLRARGGSRRQLLGYATVEAALVVAPAALLAPPAAAALVRYADRRTGAGSLGLNADLAAAGWAGPPLAWLFAAAAAVGCLAALALPAAGRGRTWVAEQRERSRPSGWQWWRQAGVDLAILLLAVLAWTQLRRYGQTVLLRDAGGLGVDPLLVAAPVIAVLATSALALRLRPLVTRLGVRLAGCRGSFASLLGMWQADRRPHAGPVLLMVLAAASAVLAPTIAATWQQSQRDQAGYAVGADLRLTGSMLPDPLLAGLPVRATMAAHRDDLLLPGGGSLPLLAVDSAQAGLVATVAGGEELFGQLHAGRPELAGLPLPAGTVRLIGTVYFDSPDPGSRTFPVTGGGETTIRVPAPVSEAITVHMADATGLISSLRTTRPAAGEPYQLDRALPAGVTRLVGLGASLQLPSGFDLAGDSVSVRTGDVRWEWADLAAVTEDGETVPLMVPDSWQVVLHPDQVAGSRVPELARGPGPDATVTAVVDPTAHPAQTVPFLLTDPPDASTVPALLTPQGLTATGAGAGVGEVIDLPGVAVRVADLVPAIPGVADGDAVVVDLAWLSVHRFRHFLDPPAVTEWWLASPEPGAVAKAAAAAGMQVQDRAAEAGRRLADPLGAGVLRTLWAAAAGAAMLAGFGLVVDARARAVGRRRELAVLHTLGTSPAGLGRSMVVEQAVLAGLAVLAGGAVGIATAATMGTSLVITPAGAVPVPSPRLVIPVAEIVTAPLALFAVALGLGTLVALRVRRDVAAQLLRIGSE